MAELLFHPLSSDRSSGTVLEIGPSRAGWRHLRFAARRLVPGESWTDETGDCEACLVLQKGTCSIRWEGAVERVMGPRESVFSSYPHAAYLPPGTRFTVTAVEHCEIADGRAACREIHKPCLIQPEDCGLEVRGGANATRQIVDILPPDFPADRLLACEVFTPAGNWSSYPPHKHDEHRPPEEVQLEEVYYYRFSCPEAFGLQRVYTADGALDETYHVADGDLVLVPRGYHPFVAAYGYDAYYLNFLAGDHRSMAASDEPRHARFKQHWPEPDPRVPLVPHPLGASV